MKKIFLFIALFISCVTTFAQEEVIILNRNYGTIPVRTCSAIFYDSGGESLGYLPGEDYKITLAPSIDFINKADSFYYKITFLDVDITAGLDSLFITEGKTNTPVPGLGTRSPYNWYNNENFISPGRTYNVGQFSKDDFSERQITFHFRSSSNSIPGRGWKIKVECIPFCQKVEASVDNYFFKVINGNRIAFPVKEGTEEVVEDGVPKTYTFKTIDVCTSDTIILKARGVYPENNTKGYEQSDETSTFYWDFGIGNPTAIHGSNELQRKFPEKMGHSLSLKVKDTIGCESTNTTDIRIRVAGNPIVAVQSLPELCSQQPILLSVGEDVESQIKTRIQRTESSPVRYFDSLTFIPDKGCIIPNEPSVTKFTVNFAGYPSNATIQSGKDIISLCVNLEHSASQNIGISLICPTGKRTLMTPTGKSSGRRTAFGYRSRFGINGNPGENPWNKCMVNDTSNQPCKTPGTYCWSEFYNRQGIDNGYLETKQNVYDMAPETDYINKTGYYKPGEAGGTETFDNLIGCPYNGEWSLEIKDVETSDNGWLYSWWLELSDENLSKWGYTVNLDTVLWDGPFPPYNNTKNTATFEPEYAGKFRYNVSVIDSFACRWDTAAYLSVHQSPIVNLGVDTLICDGSTMILDAGNPGCNYLWEPYGQTTQTIEVEKGLAGSTIDYRVMVADTRYEGLECITIDTIKVSQKPTPSASFWAEPMPLEGCEPFTVNFKNTSPPGSSLKWLFGNEGTSTEENPVHAFKAGEHTVALVSTNDVGCTDTAIYPHLVQVFSVPKPDFRWDPRFPSTQHDTIHFINLTEPQSEKNEYIWRIQNDRDNPNSFTYILDSVNPTYKITTKNSANNKSNDIAGQYGTTLFVTTRNTGKSGFPYVCTDSTTHKIMVINDFLQFPNVITANGDGINDVFKIVNLVSGHAFPNNELFIYDRWGRKVYHKKNIDLENEAWDPAADNISAGTYFYHFIGKGYSSDVEYNGAIDVIR